MSAHTLYEHVCATSNQRTNADVLATWVVVVFSVYAIAGLSMAFFAVCAAIDTRTNGRADGHLKSESALHTVRSHPISSGSSS